MIKLRYIILILGLVGCSKTPENTEPPVEPPVDPNPVDTVFLKNVLENPYPDTSLVLVFNDEFDGTSLNWKYWGSEAYGSNLKNETSRGPENAKVEDGELRLYVKKETNTYGNKTTYWTSAYIYLKEALEPNSYIETRFKPTQCTGVNNAFWTSCRTINGDEYSNRYEIDMVETRKKESDGKGNAHLAWHDWKTYAYGKENGVAADNASGTSFDHTYTAYQKWGLWLGENEFAINLEDNAKGWDGKTGTGTRKNIWYDGDGKLDGGFNPSEDVAQKAYGNYGQSDWTYYGGYTGDQMNLVFANLPWEATWSPLTDDADGTYMAIQYLRIYKPKYTQETVPLQSVVVDSDLLLKSRVTGNVIVSNSTITIDPNSAIDIALNHKYSLKKKQNVYLGLTLKKSGNTSANIILRQENDERIMSFGVNGENRLTLGVNNIINTGNAFPSKDKNLFQNDIEYRMILRITAKENEKDIVSLVSYRPMLMPKKEPFLYYNFDDKGNTSITNGWHLNQRANMKSMLRYITVEGEGKVYLKDIKVGTSYVSVL